MKILLINPNTSSSVTALIAAEAERAIHTHTQLQLATARRGVAYIETAAEAVVGAAEVLEIIAEAAADPRKRPDGVIVAAFGDPGVMAAKELFPFPVIGLTEAAVAQAFLLGGSFAIVGISARIGLWYEQVVEHLGMTSRFVGFYGLSASFSDVGSVQHDKRQALLTLIDQAIDAGADTVILGGAPLAGLARDIDAEARVPLIDGVGSAVRFLEATVRAAPAVRQAGVLSAPPQKPSRHLTPALREFMGTLGNRGADESDVPGASEV